MKNLFLSAFFVATTFAIEDYNYRPTECEVSKCVSGWCKYEGCTESISCPGGLCYFSKCKNPVCEGGVCTFDNCENPTCPGGACKFTNVPTTLTEGYCAGGACKLEDESFPSSLESTLSQ